MRFPTNSLGELPGLTDMKPSPFRGKRISGHQHFRGKQKDKKRPQRRIRNNVRVKRPTTRGDIMKADGRCYRQEGVEHGVPGGQK